METNQCDNDSKTDGKPPHIRNAVRRGAWRSILYLSLWCKHWGMIYLCAPAGTSSCSFQSPRNTL